MLAYFLYGLFFISCLVLIAAVLLQPGKSDAGALFTSNISSTAFGPRGTQSVLSKITITVAALFMVSALLLSMPAITGNVSVLQTTSGTTNETKPAAATDSNTANTNVTANTENTKVTTSSVNANVANQPNNAAPSNSKVENKTSNTKANK
ncbi:MAG: preprotein translocase subunit SecG [Pyrinomonadaceae bacterium]|nr:preprotein translocase subunit SecG [Pyrinomonadaceae bacterium]